MAKVGPSSLVGPLSGASRVGGKVDAGALHDIHLLDRSRAAAKAARAAGLADGAADLERVNRNLDGKLRLFDYFEGELLRFLPGLMGMASLRAAAGAVRARAFHPMFGRFSPADWTLLFEKALAVMVRGQPAGQGHLNAMTGLVREVLSKQLPEVAREVDAVRASLRGRTAGSPDLSFLDSAVHATVELPTLPRGGQRDIRLGTDRLVGLAQADPQPVRTVVAGAPGGVVRVSGTLDLALAMEVKGLSNAVNGVEQLRALLQRGSQGYAIIGNELWLIRYTPRQVRHLLIAPEGAELARADALARRLAAEGVPIEVVAIPRAIDAQIRQVGEALLAVAAKYLHPG